MKRSREAWVKFLATRLVGVAVDSSVVAIAYLSAFALRFDFQEPVNLGGWFVLPRLFPNVLVVYLVSLIATGCYRLAWRRTGVAEFPRYVAATFLATVVLTLMRYFLPQMSLSHVRPPYSITAICFFLVTIGVISVRMLWRAYWKGRIREADLIARSIKRFDDSIARRFLSGKTVMVTGAGGSIGSEIVRQVAAAGAKLVLMVERGENALYEIDRAMRGAGFGDRTVPLMIDINEREKIEKVFATYHPSIVLHAAAYKHVPMVEMNPEEGWRNNTEATRQLAGLALEYGVARFVMISTDKAVNPVSVMGKTKLAAEKAIMALNTQHSTLSTKHQALGTSFCAVRFGNVFGSSGSVVQLFRELIAAKKPLPVTHPEMKRYFMTVSEAVALVLQAASREERAIYTLDMGEPVKIVDLAEGMIEQAGYRPYVDIPIVFTGIRPGEKLFEEIDVSEKSCYKTDMAKIYITK